MGGNKPSKVIITRTKNASPAKKSHQSNILSFYKGDPRKKKIQKFGGVDSSANEASESSYVDPEYVFPEEVDPNHNPSGGPLLESISNKSESLKLPKKTLKVEQRETSKSAKQKTG